jgi:hypothetical protein
VKDEFDDGGKNGEIQNGWAWYMGIERSLSEAGQIVSEPDKLV